MKKGLKYVLFLLSIISLFGCENEIQNEKKLETKNTEIVEQIEEEKIEEYYEEKKYFPVEEITIEINDKLPSIDKYFGEKVKGSIKYLKNDKEVSKEKINKTTGKYVVILTVDEKEYTSKLIVKDTKKPTLELRNVTIEEGKKYSENTFIVKCSDNSGKYKVSFKSNDMKNYTKPGQYKITIKAVDDSLNSTTKTATLTIKAKAKSNKTSNKSNVKKIVSSTDKYKEQAKKLISTNSKLTKEIVDITNKYRKEAGVKTLKLNDKLSQAANIRAMELAYNDYFAHERPNGDPYWTVLNDLKIQRKGSGENLAKGYEDALEVCEAWKESKGHYANMINKNYNSIGIGYFELDGKTYHVQIFANL